MQIKTKCKKIGRVAYHVKVSTICLKYLIFWIDIITIIIKLYCNALEIQVC